jgi:hypothetical protein
MLSILENIVFKNTLIDNNFFEIISYSMIAKIVFEDQKFFSQSRMMIDLEEIHREACSR